MSQFDIKPGLLQQREEDFAEIYKELQTSKESLKYLKKSLAKLKSEPLLARIDRACERIEECAVKSTTMKTSLENIIVRYEKAEKESCSKSVERIDASVVSTTENVFQETYAGVNVVSDIIDKLFDLDKGIIGKAGGAGAIAKTIIDVITGDWTKAKTIGSTIKNVGGIVDKIAYNVKQSGAKWAEGFFKTTKRASKGFVSELSENLKKGVCGSSGAGFPTGVVLSGIANAFGNYDEYKAGEISGTRAVAETLVETGVDIGKDALIMAGLTAATGGTGLLVSAGAVAVGWAVDWVSESIFGEKVTEVVSDALIDGAKAVGEFFADTGEVIADVAGAVTETVIDAVGTVGKVVSNVTSGAVKAVTDAATGLGKAVSNGVGKIAKGASNFVKGFFKHIF